MTADYSIAVHRSPDGRVWVFDSHARDAFRGRPASNGKAVLVRLNGIAELVEHVKALYGSQHNRRYTLTPVVLQEDARPETGPVVIQGTISQDHFSFPESSRGRQGAAMSAAACCVLLEQGAEGWTSETVDMCVAAGELMFTESNVADGEHLKPEGLTNIAKFDFNKAVSSHSPLHVK